MPAIEAPRSTRPAFAPCALTLAALATCPSPAKAGQTVEWVHVLPAGAVFSTFSGSGTVCEVQSGRLRSSLMSSDGIAFELAIDTTRDGGARVNFRPMAGDGSFLALAGTMRDHAFHGGSGAIELSAYDRQSGAYLLVIIRSDSSPTRIPRCA